MNFRIPAFSGRRGQIIPDSAKIPQSSLGHSREIAEIISVRFPEENATFALTTADVARGLRSATRTSTPDAGKGALTSFRGEPVSSTAPSREGFRMTRYQFFHNSYESLRLFLLILIATNPRQRGCNDNCKMSVRRIDKNVVTNKNRSVLSSAHLILYFANL